MRPVPAVALPLILALQDPTAQLRTELERLPREQGAPVVVGLDAVGEHRTLPAPGEGEPCGLAWCRDTLWLLRDRTLLRVDPKNGAALESLPAEAWVALAADRRFLYAASATGEIAVIDPIAGRLVRSVPPPADLPAPIRGITVLGDHMLFADADGRVLQLSADRARATPFWRHPGWAEPTWIGADHDHLVVARDGLVHWIHSSHGDVLRTAGSPEPTLTGTTRGNELWMLRSSPRGDEFYVLVPYRELDCVVVGLIGVGGPGVGAPGAAPGDVTHWIVGRQRANTPARLIDVLREARRAERRTETIGGRVLAPFVLHVHPGVTIGDVIATLDAAAAAGVELRTPGLAVPAVARDR